MVRDVEVLLYLVLECRSRIELRVKVNTNLSMRKGRLYAHRDIP